MELDQLDVLRYFINQGGEVTHQELRGRFPTIGDNNLELKSVLVSLMGKGFITTVKSPNSTYQITYKGREELRRIDEGKELELELKKGTIELNRKQSKVIDEQLPLIQEQLRYYKRQRIWQWIGIGISILLALLSLLKDPTLTYIKKIH